MALDLYQEPESKWIEYLRKHWSKGLMAILILATIFVWTERAFGKKHVGNREDYIMASRCFSRFMRGEQIDLESLLSCEAIVQKHPELKLYQPMLASCFFAQNDPQKALSWASKALERNQNELPSAYRDFAKASLLIAEDQHEQALALTRTIEAERGSILEAFVIMRLAMLGEKGSWEKLHAHERYSEVAALFSEGGITLEMLHPAPSV
ncbi:MAG: hypothetical protein S4CHLAM81_14490 [Chlamydiales bacterium]|nr:hypothetical protein [Chlamydiales bacterium]MCH9636221.1 hypothetical protein [Chlamydiales bacterium]MCH9703794.1 hypothetical protein [Chlamydiota bacterium]